jgi:hypothetical protein
MWHVTCHLVLVTWEVMGARCDKFHKFVQPIVLSKKTIKWQDHGPNGTELLARDLWTLHCLSSFKLKGSSNHGNQKSLTWKKLKRTIKQIEKQWSLLITLGIFTIHTNN